MSLPAALAVRQSIYQALLSDSSVLNKIGSNAIFDEAPGKVDPPYIAFGPVVLSDVSAHGTLLRDFLSEVLRLIFTLIGVEDDEETRQDEGPC